MARMTTEQRKKIYGLANQLGIYEKGNKDDNLHAIVFNFTKKASISELASDEAESIISELFRLRGNATFEKSEKVKKPEAITGMITQKQINMVWYLMHQLADLDREPSKISLAFRLCKIIEKELKVTAVEESPFRFVNFKQGSNLIDVIKRYINNEKRKRR